MVLWALEILPKVRAKTKAQTWNLKKISVSYREKHPPLNLFFQIIHLLPFYSTCNNTNLWCFLVFTQNLCTLSQLLQMLLPQSTKVDCRFLPETIQSGNRTTCSFQWVGRMVGRVLYHPWKVLPNPHTHTHTHNHPRWHNWNCFPMFGAFQFRMWPKFPTGG